MIASTTPAAATVTVSGPDIAPYTLHATDDMDLVDRSGFNTALIHGTTISHGRYFYTPSYCADANSKSIAAGAAVHAAEAAHRAAEAARYSKVDTAEELEAYAAAWEAFVASMA